MQVGVPDVGRHGDTQVRNALPPLCSEGDTAVDAFLWTGARAQPARFAVRAPCQRVHRIGNDARADGALHWHPSPTSPSPVRASIAGRLVSAARTSSRWYSR